MELNTIAKSISVAALLSCAGLGVAQADSVLVLRDVGDIQQMDPLASTNYPMRDMSYLLWDTLFAMDENFEAQPQMVGAYSVSDDGMTYEFTLRDGLLFHDGAPVTTVDVIASIERWMTKDSLGLQIAQRLVSMEAIDDSSWRIVLNEPFGQLLNGLGRMTAYPLFIMPERLAKTPIGEKLPDLIGSGPFKLAEWRPGVVFAVEKFQEYVPRDEPPSNLAGGKVAKVDRIERATIPDDMSAVNALLSGEIDLLKGIPYDALALLDTEDNLEYGARPLLGQSIQIVLNHTQPPFDNIKVRQAVQLALSQQDFMATLLGDRDDLYEICAAIFMCGGPFETDVNSERYMNENFEASKALLEEAGYDGTPITYLHPVDQQFQRDMGTVLIDKLRSGGFVVDARQIDLATMFSRRSNNGPVSEGGWNMFLTAFGGDAMMDPLTNPYVSGACEEAFVGWPCDEELQANWREFLLADTNDARMAAAVKIQDRSNEIVTFVPMGQYFGVTAWKTSVSGQIDSPVSVYWNIEKAE
ncbi:ABC transporter substrate-binding protein [Pseudotabrizicola sp. 4114]|uniref:ABC transporter substrate-binding protein n=1 Tax=Pseudotabrizicola sp. 4114 TaxID=2817731 RepID=UPI002863D717|nr:peptide/nickel transport system substrate-binding protein [Pseudorhodobacter sp. 4114]